MAATLLLVGALMAQAAVTLAPADTAATTSRDRVEVGYQELAQGRPQDAISRIRASSRAESSDPAALINLGAAFARLGQADKAEASYLAAIASEERYDLEIADGSWMDSRRAARHALRQLDSGQVLALR